MSASKPTNITIFGECHPKFSAVKDTFYRNFQDFGDIGTRITLMQGDDTLVDLWAGHTDEDRSTLFDEQTLINTMSVGKGVASLAVHLLHDRGLVDYDAPVARYWPEFAQNGKSEITVRMLLGHLACVISVDDPVPGDALDWPRMVEKIEAQAPNWAPGTNPSYHAVTYGYLVGELVRKIDGRTIDVFVDEEISKPLGADFFFGCSDDQLARVATVISNPKNTLMNGGLMNERTAQQFKVLPENDDFFATPEHWRSVMPSSSGVSNAKALAKIFSPLANAGRFGSTQFFKPETIDQIRSVLWHQSDSLFGSVFAVSMGMLIHSDFNYYGREGNFGSAGAGGYFAFADPENHLSFGYTPVRQTTGDGMGVEPKRIIDAIYSCISTA